MIDLTEYTSYAEVRAVLGVSIYELPDATLALDMFTQRLQTRLRSTTGTFGATTGSLITIFDALSALSSPTADEEDMLFLIRQYALYLVAENCLTGLSLFALKSESDGKTTQTRFSPEATFKDVAAAVRQQLNSLAAQLDETLTGAGFSLPLLSRAEPAVDRVTNESA